MSTGPNHFEPLFHEFGGEYTQVSEHWNRGNLLILRPFFRNVFVLSECIKEMGMHSIFSRPTPSLFVGV